MNNWQDISQQLMQIVNTIIRFVKARRREEASIGLAAILFWLGYSLIKWLPEELQGFVKSWNGDSIIPGILFVAGAGFLFYGIYRIWKLVYTPDLPDYKDRPAAIKGPLAFTETDGELFWKLGRETDLKKLLGYVEDNQVPMIVLMGASGAGKTSLLRAGLTHIIKGKNIEYHYWEAVPTDSARSLLRAVQESWNSNSNGSADDSNQTVPTAELKSLNSLINPAPELGKSRHVIILDQFEQLRGKPGEQIFKLLQKVAREAKPPYSITWIIAFRREFRADWSDFIIPEQEKRRFYPPEISLRLFTAEQAKDVISQLVAAADLKVEEKVVDNLIEAATVEGEVSSVDIGIGLLVLSELSARQSGKTVTEEDYHFAGGAQGLLTQYISRSLDHFPDEDRETIMNAMLALRDPETDQRLAEGKTAAEIAEEIKTDPRRLKIQLERLTQRDTRLLEHVEANHNNDENTRYRLPHERLIPALNRLAGRLVGELEVTKQKFTDAFTAWRKNNAPQYLLKGKDLRLVERYKSQIPWGKDETEKLKFLKRSRRHRTLKRLTAMVVIISLTVGSWFIYAQYRNYEIGKQVEEAKNYLRDNNYPPELYDWQQQLKSLELDEAFNTRRFPWLHSNTLEELTVKVTESTNSIDGLVDSLMRCPTLKKLHLNLADSQVNNIESLAKLTNLTALTLELNLEIGDIEALGRLTNLTKLTFNASGAVKNIQILSNLTNLTELNLDISGSEVTHIQALNKLTNLSTLTLTLNGQIINLEPLNNLINLTKLTLDLSTSEISDTNALNRLANLTVITLITSKVSNIEILNKLTKLSELTLNLKSDEESYITNNEVNNLVFWDKLTNLTKLNLDLSESKVNNIEFLNKLTKLSELTLNLNSKTSNIRNLGKLTNLTKLILELAYTEVVDINALNKLTNLSALTLSINSDVISLKPLNKLINLTELNLSINSDEESYSVNDELSDFGFLNSLTNLTKLNLSFKYIKMSSLEPLSNLTNLTELNLDLSASEVTHIKVLGKLTNLTELTLNLSLSAASNLEPLNNLINLTKLNLNFNGSEIIDINALNKLTHLTELTLSIYGEAENLEPLNNLINLTKLNLDLSASEISNLEPVLKLNYQTLELRLNTDQRMSLKSIPKSVTHLKF